MPAAFAAGRMQQLFRHGDLCPRSRLLTAGARPRAPRARVDLRLRRGETTPQQPPAKAHEIGIPPPPGRETPPAGAPAAPGLTGAEARARLAEHGPNAIER